MRGFTAKGRKDTLVDYPSDWVDTMDNQMNRLPRKFDGKEKNYVLPCSIAFIIKNIDSFDQKKCKFTALITIVIRVKLTGLPNIKNVLR